jgi:hypothetical protein
MAKGHAIEGCQAQGVRGGQKYQCLKGQQVQSQREDALIRTRALINRVIDNSTVTCS